MNLEEMQRFENMLLKFTKMYGEYLHNDRFTACITVSQTVNNMILTGKYLHTEEVQINE